VLNGYLECRFPRKKTEEEDEEGESLAVDASVDDEETQQLAAIAAKIRANREKRRAQHKAEKAKTKKDRSHPENR
jgi:hypothetical protein